MYVLVAVQPPLKCNLAVQRLWLNSHHTPAKVLWLSSHHMKALWLSSHHSQLQSCGYPATTLNKSLLHGYPATTWKLHIVAGPAIFHTSSFSSRSGLKIPSSIRWKAYSNLARTLEGSIHAGVLFTLLPATATIRDMKLSPPYAQQLLGAKYWHCAG